MDTLLTVPAAWRISNEPTAVEPVKLILRTSGWVVSTRPISGASSAAPVTTLNTPGGRPARTPSAHTASADSGVCSAGLSTTVFPAASAGAAFLVTMATGKFHGVMHAPTPSGCRIVNMRCAVLSLGTVSP